MLFSRSLVKVLFATVGFCLVILTMRNQREGLENAPTCETSATVLPFKNAGNVAALQSQMAELQASTSKAVSGYDVLETEGENFGSRLSKLEEKLESLQSSIKKNGEEQAAKVKQAQSQLDKFDLGN